jgi:glycosyltransferase involved in cell wall biosynthesis
MMRIAVGILAWNESKSIPQTIRSLFEQTLLASPDASIEQVELTCVPNGCTDDTAAVAKAEFARALTASKASAVVCKVEEVAKAGKANAWNEYVHRFSDQRADFIIMMDADVSLVHPRTLENMISTLAAAPHANASIPRRVKHLELKPRRTLRDRVSLGASEIGQSRPAMLAGCLYCARGSVIRRIWLPEGLVGEDAFLGAMLVTNLFTDETRNERIVRAPDATVLFEAYTRFGDVLYNLRRRAVTRCINAMMYDFLWKHVDREVGDAGQLIKRLNDEDPDWFRRIIKERVARSGWLVFEPRLLFVRLTHLKYVPLSRRIVLAPVALIGCALDIVAHLMANSAIKRGKIKGVWRDKVAGPAVDGNKGPPSSSTSLTDRTSAAPTGH